MAAIFHSILFRSRIAHEARSPPPRQPALARHSQLPMSHRGSRPTSPRTALRKRSPAQHAPHPRLPCTALHEQPTHCAHSSAFAQHTLPRHRTSPPLRASPSPGPSPPSPDCGSAPPPPSRRPALPINLCATCPAVSICPHDASAIAVCHDSMHPASCARWDGGHTFTRNAHRRRLVCAATPGCKRTSLMCWQQSYSSPLLACSAGSMSSAALQAHMYCRHTCIAAHLGQMQCCCGFVLSPARAGLGWTPPLNGCSQGLVVRGIIPPCTLSLKCHTKVFSKVSNSLPIHQYFPAASPYGAQSGGWIGMTD